MTIPNRSIEEVRSNIIAQLELKLNQRIRLIPKTFLYILATAMAGVHVTLYKYSTYIFRQMFVATASGQETTIGTTTLIPLVMHGRLIGIGDPASASFAEFTVDITVVNQVGTLPAGTQFIRRETGVVYLSLTSVDLDAATKTVAVQASGSVADGNGGGTIGNVNVGEQLQFLNPLPNVDRTVVVNEIALSAVDGETIEQYRQRIIDRFQQRPQGGALADYAQWSEEVVGIINSYPYTGLPGQVDVYVEATAESAGNPDGIPTGTQIAQVKESIEVDAAGRATRRPANAFVNVYPITRSEFEVNVTGLVVSDPTTVQAQVEAALAEFFTSAEPYIDGLALPPRTDRITQSAVTQVVSVVVANANGYFDSLTVTQGAAPFTIYQLGAGEKAKLASVAFA